MLGRLAREDIVDSALVVEDLMEQVHFHLFTQTRVKREIEQNSNTNSSNIRIDWKGSHLSI